MPKIAASLILALALSRSGRRDSLRAGNETRMVT